MMMIKWLEIALKSVYFWLCRSLKQWVHWFSSTSLVEFKTAVQQEIASVYQQKSNE